jgi:hypothetical protein
MKWLRPSDIDDASLAEVAGTLEAAVAAAPPSPHAAAIRGELLASLDAGRRPVPLLGPLAIVAVVLLAVAIFIGAPAVGSFLERLDDLPPAPVPTALPAPFPTPTQAASPPVEPSSSAPAAEDGSPSPEATSIAASPDPGFPVDPGDPPVVPAATAAPDEQREPAELLPQPTPTPTAAEAVDPTATPTPEPQPSADPEDLPCVDLPLLPCIPLPLGLLDPEA